MKNSFRQFELTVQHVCHPEDFKQNKSKLKDVQLSSYETFIYILKLGAGIINAVRATDELYKLSIQTNLTESDLVQLSTKFRFINSLIEDQSIPPPPKK